MSDLDNIQNNIYYNEEQKALIAEKDYTTVDDGVRHHDVVKEYDDGRKFEREPADVIEQLTALKQSE